MTCLAIDTAGPLCSVALVSGKVLAVESERIGRGHAERLMPMIGDVLGQAGQNYDDLSRIAVTTGPGSFTGVRIGISAARGLALALGVKAVGIGVLDVMCEKAFRLAEPDGNITVVAILDAGRGEVFVQAVKGAITRPGRTIALSPRKCPPAEAGRLIDGLAGEIHLTGPAGLLDPAVTSHFEADHADVTILAQMAIAGAGTSPPRPLYLRAPDAKPQTGKAVAHA